MDQIVENAPVVAAERRFPSLRAHALKLAVVLLPTLLAALYYGLVASDVYVSESRFVVRSPERGATTALGVMLRGVGFARSQDDAYTVQDYVRSRDALRRLDAEFALSDSFASREVDIMRRFGALDWDTSFEALHRYYQNRLDVAFDTASSIITLRTSAFSAAQAHAMNRRLLELSEQLVNRINDRGRRDMIRFAEREVASAQEATARAAAELASYRDDEGVIDPERESAVQLQFASRLQEELLASRMALAQTERVAPASPQLPGLRSRVRELERELERSARDVAGGAGSLAAKAERYQRFIVQRETADRALASALTSLEQARNEAGRKQVYIERVVEPSLPDVATEPRRLRSVLATLVISLIAWGILSIVLAGVREHGA